jgi:phage terminase small subunit
MALSTKQLAFVERYLTHWNATRAAIDAGYSEQSARKQGSRLSTNADIQAQVQARLAELTMSADEVLVRLADHARGSMDDFLDINGDINLSLARDNGKLHLLKSRSVTKEGERIELYDSQAALALIGKHHGLFVERIDVSVREIEAFLDRLKDNLSADEYARIVALAAGAETA